MAVNRPETAAQIEEGLPDPDLERPFFRASSDKISWDFDRNNSLILATLNCGFDFHRNFRVNLIKEPQGRISYLIPNLDQLYGFYYLSTILAPFSPLTNLLGKKASAEYAAKESELVSALRALRFQKDRLAFRQR